MKTHQNAFARKAKNEHKILLNVGVSYACGYFVLNWNNIFSFHLIRHGASLMEKVGNFLLLSSEQWRRWRFVKCSSQTLNFKVIYRIVLPFIKPPLDSSTTGGSEGGKRERAIERRTLCMNFTSHRREFFFSSHKWIFHQLELFSGI